MSHLNPNWQGSDPASWTDLSAFDIRLILTLPIPDGDIATLHQICTVRSEQVSLRGHTPQADAGLPAIYLPRKAREYVDDAIDCLQRDRPDLAIRKLVKSAALILAAIARLRLIRSEQP